MCREVQADLHKAVRRACMRKRLYDTNGSGDGRSQAEGSGSVGDPPAEPCPKTEYLKKSRQGAAQAGGCKKKQVAQRPTETPRGRIVAKQLCGGEVCRRRRKDKL